AVRGPKPCETPFPYTKLFRSWTVILSAPCPVHGRRSAMYPLPHRVGSDELCGRGMRALSTWSCAERFHRQSGKRSAQLQVLSARDRKSTRLNSSHVSISYAVI